MNPPPPYHDDELETLAEGLLYLFDPYTLRGWATALLLLAGIGHLVSTHEPRKTQFNSPPNHQTTVQK